VKDIATDSAVQYMEGSTIDTLESWRLKESSTLQELYLSDLDYNENLMKEFIVPSSNRVKMSTGETVDVPSTVNLFMFPTRKRLYDENEYAARLKPKVQTLKERGELKRRSFVVFVNGKKVPDDRVLVYASQNGTDVFIPCSYFDKKNLNSLVCTVHEYGECYLQYYIDNTLSRMIGDTSKGSISIPPRLRAKIIKRYILVYVDGLLLEPAEFEITIDGLCFSVELVGEPSSFLNKPVEVVVDSSILGSFSNRYINSSNDLFFFIPKDNTMTLDFAIFQYMCDIYLNGERIPSYDIAQKSYRHFLYKRPLTENVVTSRIVLSDKRKLSSSFYPYIDSFMQYEMWADEKQTIQQLAGEIVEDTEIQPPFINYKQLAFPPENKYIVDEKVTSLMSNLQRIKAMIAENTNYFRALLSYYGIKEEEYTVTRGEGIDDDNKKVGIVLENNDGVYPNRDDSLLEVYINGKKIQDTSLTYVNKAGADYIQIPMKFFRKGKDPQKVSNASLTEDKKYYTDVIHLYRYKTTSCQQGSISFECAPQDWMHSNTWIDICDIPGVSGNLFDYDISELVVYQRTNRDTDKNHFYIDMEGAVSYFGIVHEKNKDGSINYSLRHELHDDGKEYLQIIIPEGSCIQKDSKVYISNPRFHSQRTFTVQVTANSLNNESRLVLNSVDRGEVIPKAVGDYLIKLFINGSCCIKDVDYFISSPETRDTVVNTIIIFRRKVEIDDVIEIVYTGTKNRWLCGYSNIPASNKFGLLYLSALRIPFSTDYIDVYLNEKKLDKDDIVVYTDRLVRIKNNLLPFRNVSFYTRLSVGYPDLNPYIEEHMKNRDPFDVYIEEFCKSVDYETDSEGDKSINDIFETTTIGTDDDGNPIYPDVIPEDPDVPPIQQIDPFLDRFGRDFNTDRNQVTKYFDANEFKLIDFDEYLILLNEKTLATHHIVLNANSPEKIHDDFIFDPNRYYRNVPEIMKVIADTFNLGFITKDMDSNAPISKYTDPLLSTYLYPRDVIPLDSNRVFTEKELQETVVLDSNIVP